MENVLAAGYLGRDLALLVVAEADHALLLTLFGYVDFGQLGDYVRREASTHATYFLL